MVVVEVTIHTWKVRAQARLPFLHVENIVQNRSMFSAFKYVMGTNQLQMVQSQEMISQGCHHQLALAILLGVLWLGMGCDC